MDQRLLKDYRDVSEKIGKLYSDLESLESRRAELERAIQGTGVAPVGAGVAPVGAALLYGETLRPRHVDKQATQKTHDFLKHHFIANKICTPEMLVKEFGCTEGAATTRLRKAAQNGLGKLLLSPLRLEKN